MGTRVEFPINQFSTNLGLNCLFVIIIVPIFFFCGQDNLLGVQFWAMGRFDLLGGQNNLLGGQIPTQLTCYLPPWLSLLKLWQISIFCVFLRGCLLRVRQFCKSLGQNCLFLILYFCVCSAHHFFCEQDNILDGQFWANYGQSQFTNATQFTC